MITKETTYTEEYVTKELESILEEVLDNEDIIYIGELFPKRPYCRQRFSAWAKKFPHDDKIVDTIKKIRNILETRINVGGLKGELNANMVKFNLTNNYSENWKEKDEPKPNLNINIDAKDIQSKSASDISKYYTELLRSTKDS